jgi:hypothetical protein
MSDKKLLKYCIKCLMPNTRPRISFDLNGICNACSFNERKKKKTAFHCKCMYIGIFPLGSSSRARKQDKKKLKRRLSALFSASEHMQESETRGNNKNAN